MTLPTELSGLFKNKNKSYKMIFILILLEQMKSQQRSEISLQDIKKGFLSDLQKNEQLHLPVDPAPPSLGSSWSAVSPSQIHSLILTPVDALKSVIQFDNEKQTVSFSENILMQWSDQIAAELKVYAENELYKHNNSLRNDFDLKSYLYEIMSNYLSEKQKPIKNNQLEQTIRLTVANGLKELAFINDPLVVSGSAGKGNWAVIPWIAIRDPNVSSSIQTGEYVVYLFSEDMNSVYLTLNQGVTAPKNTMGKKEAYRYLLGKVEEMRQMLPLEEMNKDDEIHLTNENGLGRDYQVSTVAYYKYDRDHLPDNRILISDLQNVIENYRLYIDATESVESEGAEDKEQSGNFPYTVAHIYYGQGIMRYFNLHNIEDMTLKELTENYVDVLKSGDEVKHPRERIQHLSRFLQDLGLLKLTGEQLRLSEIGYNYIQSFDSDNWKLSDNQLYVLRNIIEHSEKPTSLVLVIKEAIEIVSSLSIFSSDDFQAPFIHYLGVENQWNEVTRKNRTQFMLNWLQDLRYLEKKQNTYYFVVSEDGEPPVIELSPIEDADIQSAVNHIKSFITHKGFSYPGHLIETFYLSLKAKPFVILAGISGTGKTQLVRLFAEAVGATKDNQQFTLVPVRPDWSDPSDLIGFQNLNQKFIPGKLTEVIVEASKEGNHSKPYFICLDEMNLARVEHYFSDVLSILETQKRQEDRVITDTVVSIGEDKYCIPDNLFIIGTVNMDETTHPFSKKVLDRANTIEFNYIELMNFPEPSLTEASTSAALPASFLRSDYLVLKDAYADHTNLIEHTTEKLVIINSILEGTHSHIGFRVRDTVCFFLIYNERFGNLMSENDAFDAQMMQKILPRIQGSNQSVKKVIIQLLRFCEGEQPKIVNDSLLNDASQLYEPYGKSSSPAGVIYPQSAKKLAYMLRRMDEDGFTSFWLS